MKVYRIAKQKYIKDLSGTGSKMYGGRWNQKGTSVLYTSENISLAVLETLVHVDIDNLPTDLKLLILNIPDSVTRKELDIKNLPTNWRDYPAPDKLADIGSKWVDSSESLILQVPSVVIPGENNLLINPNHPEFKKVNIDEIVDFKFDDRFSK